MKKKHSKKKSLSIRLKTSFAIQSHLNEFVYLMKVIDDYGDSFEEKEAIVKILMEALSDSLKIVFPNNIEA